MVSRTNLEANGNYLKKIRLKTLKKRKKNLT